MFVCRLLPLTYSTRLQEISVELTWRPNMEGVEMDAVPSALSRSLQCLVPAQRKGAVAVWMARAGGLGTVFHIFFFQRKG